MDDAEATRTLSPALASRAGGRTYLLVVEGGSSSLYPLPRSGEVLIGRSEEADLRLDEQSASRNHAKILVGEGELRVVDLGSHNGTRVNGERIDAPRTLSSGDVIAIGECTLVLHSAPRAPAARSLTELRRLRQRSDEEVARALEAERPLGVVLIALGAAAVDEPTVAGILDAVLRLTDVAAFTDDGQLLVLLPELPAELVGSTAALLVEALAPVAPAVRAGVATCPADGCDSEVLFAAARDAAALAAPGAVAEASRAATQITRR